MRDAVVLPLRLLPIHWPLTVRVALDLLGRRGVCGLPSVAVDVLVTVSAVGVAAVDIDGARATGEGGCLGGSSTYMIAGIGVFRRVCRWCVRGVVWRMRGHVGLLDGVSPTATLGVGAVATLDGVAPSTLCGSALSTLGGAGNSYLWWGLLHTMAASFLTAAMCFCLSAVEVEINFWNAERRSASAAMVLSCSLAAGSVQPYKSKRYVPVILYPLVAGT